MKIKLAVVLFLLFGSSALAQNSLNLAVRPIGNRIAVDVTLSNQDTLSGLQIPLDLHLSKLGIRVDSVSFVGSRCAHFYELSSRVLPEQDRLFIMMIESADPTLISSPLMPGSGKIATIYISRTGQPRETNWQITNEPIDDKERDLRFMAWTNWALEVPLTFHGAAFNLAR
jgi:hypothetical protein